MAELAGACSQPIAVDRRATIVRRTVRGGTVRVVARVRGVARGAAVTLDRRFGCGATEPYGKARAGRGGEIVLTLPLPPAGADPVLYRVVAPVGRGASYTLPIVVTSSAAARRR